MKDKNGHDVKIGDRVRVTSSIFFLGPEIGFVRGITIGEDGEGNALVFNSPAGRGTPVDSSWGMWVKSHEFELANGSVIEGGPPVVATESIIASAALSGITILKDGQPASAEDATGAVRELVEAARLAYTATENNRRDCAPWALRLGDALSAALARFQVAEETKGQSNE